MHLVYINQTGFQWVARMSALPLLFPFIVVSGMKQWNRNVLCMEVGEFSYNWPIKVFFSQFWPVGVILLNETILCSKDERLFFS